MVDGLSTLCAAQLFRTSKRNTSARTPPRAESHGKELHVGVGVDADVAERGLQVGVDGVRRVVGRGDPVLRGVRLVDAGEVSTLELLPLNEQPRRATARSRGRRSSRLVEVQEIDEVHPRWSCGSCVGCCVSRR